MHICTEKFGAEKCCHLYYEILINILISATLISVYFVRQYIEIEVKCYNEYDNNGINISIKNVMPSQFFVTHFRKYANHPKKKV